MATTTTTRSVSDCCNAYISRLAKRKRPGCYPPRKTVIMWQCTKCRKECTYHTQTEVKEVADKPNEFIYLNYYEGRTYTGD